MSMIRRRVVVTGIVQGVWFRASTRDAAVEAGVTGWVRNLPNGSVEAVFEGEENQVERAVTWCHRGSPGSRVDKVQVVEEKYTGKFGDFAITYARGAF
jgi:acylphosphatase